MSKSYDFETINNPFQHATEIPQRAIPGAIIIYALFLHRGRTRSV